MKNKLTFIIVIILLIVALPLLFKSRIAEYVSTRAESELLKKKIFVDIRDSNFGFVNYNAKKAEIKYSSLAYPVELELENILVVPKLLSLLGANKEVDISTNLYDGILISNIHYLSSDNKIKVNDFDIRGLKLSEHPQIKMLNISNGTLDVKLNSAEINNDQFSYESFDVYIENFQKRVENFIPSWLLGIPMDIVIPKIYNGVFSINSKAKNNVIEISKLFSKSNLGKLELEAKLEIKNRKARILQMRGRVKLDVDGYALIGPYLPLITSGVLDSSDSEFSFEFRKYIGKLPIFAYGR